MESHLTDHPVYQELPIIYNHWWAYEDTHIDEETLLKNAALAASLGAELLVLDAGWFGNDSFCENWYDVRGDWDLVNHKRFPHGLAHLKKEVEKTGLKFGIWCEIEGLGKNAKLALTHPEFAAKRDGENLPYLCFGNPDVVDWAFETLSALFEKCGFTYWKLDFNLDPGIGCNDTSHHHGSHDGLYRHYEGLYTLLDRLRCAYPDLIIENCSSGGQRMNLEMAEHTHLHFLSDPDYSAHQMHLFKEASKWFLPKQLLHFMWSNTVTVNGSSPFPGLNSESLSKHELKYHLRLAMLHPFGISHRLPEYSIKTLNIIKEEIARYKEYIRPFIACGHYLPLYQSDTVNIFRFSKDNEQLIFFFAEKAGETLCPVTGLNSSDFYDVYVITQDFLTVCFKEVLNKVHFISTSDWFSCIIKIVPHP